MKNIRPIVWPIGFLLLLVGAEPWSGIRPVYAQGVEVGTWASDRAPMPTARKEIANATITMGGKVYVAGGVARNGATINVLEVYDPAADTWSVAAPLPLAVWRAATAALDGRVYLFGGYRTAQFPFSPSNRVFAYDPTTDQWTEKAPMSQARGAMVAVSVEGKIHVMGGLGGPNDTALTLHEVYDPASDTWGTLTPMPRPRSGHAAVVYEGVVYAVGGYRLSGGVVSQDVVEAYDPIAETWQLRRPLPTARHGIAATVLDERIFVFGGTTTASVPSAGLEYDPAADAWRQTSQMPSPVSFMGVAAVGDKIYVIGGGAVNLNRFDGLDLNRVFVPATLTTAAEEKPPGPVAFQLRSAYPNPFTAATTMTYQVSAQSHVTLTIHDLLGRTVRTLVDEPQGPGAHVVVWDGRQETGDVVSPGVYLYRLQTAHGSATRRLVRLH